MIIMKLPNGYGSIIKLSGKRRKPYNVRITVGCKEIIKDGKITYIQDRKSLGCFKTKAEALRALENYNYSPYDIDNRDMTFAEAYSLWETANLDKIRNSAYQMAIANDILQKNLAQLITIEDSDPVIERKILCKKDINTLWEHSEEWDYAILLILVYTGMRVNELLKNNKKNFDPDKKLLYIPSEIAKNKQSERFVPIHNKIYPLLLKFYSRASQNLITNDNGTVITYNNYVSRNFKKINETLTETHTLHDTRHTFISRAPELKLDDLVVRKIVGHSSNDVHEKVYTHISEKQLLKEVNKLEY